MAVFCSSTKSSRYLHDLRFFIAANALSLRVLQEEEVWEKWIIELKHREGAVHASVDARVKWQQKHGDVIELREFEHMRDLFAHDVFVADRPAESGLAEDDVQFRTGGAVQQLLTLRAYSETSFGLLFGVA